MTGVFSEPLSAAEEYDRLMNRLRTRRDGGHVVTTNPPAPVVQMEDVSLTGDEFGDILKDLDKLSQESGEESPESLIRRIRMPESMYDIIDLNDPEEAKSEDTKGIEAISRAVASSILIQVKNKSADGLFDEYLRIVHDGLEEIKKSLEAFYPGRWDLTVAQKVEQYKENIVKSIGKRDNDVTKFLANPPGGTGLEELSVYQAMVHIPEITVTNGLRGRSTVLKDTYIIFYFGYNLRMVHRFKLFRGTKNVREYNCHYNFSHATKGNNGIQSCCLGSTALDTLVTELQTMPFNAVRLDLLLQQIPDYLSWESLDGGPYITMEELYKTTSPRLATPNIGTGDMVSILDKFIKLGYIPRVTITKSNNDAGVDCVVQKDYDLWREITKVTPTSFKFPYKEGTFENIYPAVDEGARTNSQIQRINAEMPPSGLVFKGKPLKLQVLLNEEEKEKKLEDVTELMADSRLLNYVVHELGMKLSNHIQNVYWSGIEECGNSKTTASKADSTKDRAGVKGKADLVKEIAG